MNKFIASIAAFGLMTSVAFAQGVPMTFEDVDTNSDGELSYEEILAVWPDLSFEEFEQFDTDLSGGLSPEEVAALQATLTTTGEEGEVQQVLVPPYPAETATYPVDPSEEDTSPESDLDNGDDDDDDDEEDEPTT